MEAKGKRIVSQSQSSLLNQQPNYEFKITAAAVCIFEEKRVTSILLYEKEKAGSQSMAPLAVRGRQLGEPASFGRIASFYFVRLRMWTQSRKGRCLRSLSEVVAIPHTAVHSWLPAG